MEKESFRFERFYWLLVDDNATRYNLVKLDQRYIQPRRTPQPYGNFNVMITAVQQWIPLAEASEYSTWVREWKIAYKFMAERQRQLKRVLSQRHDEDSPDNQSRAAYDAMQLDALLWLRHKAKEIKRTLVANTASTGST